LEVARLAWRLFADMLYRAATICGQYRLLQHLGTGRAKMPGRHNIAAMHGDSVAAGRSLWL